MSGGRPDAWNIYAAPDEVRHRIKFLAREWHCTIPQVLERLLRSTGWMQ